jgi:hypothetical protein
VHRCEGQRVEVSPITQRAPFLILNMHLSGRIASCSKDSTFLILKRT